MTFFYIHHVDYGDSISVYTIEEGYPGNHCCACVDFTKGCLNYGLHKYFLCNLHFLLYANTHKVVEYE